MSKKSVKFPKGVKVYRVFLRDGGNLPFPIYTTHYGRILLVDDLVPSNERIVNEIVKPSGLGFMPIKDSLLETAINRGSYHQIIR